MFERRSGAPTPLCRAVADRFRWGRLRPSRRGVVCVVRAVWACLPRFSLFLADLPFRLDSLFPLVFRPSPCRCSGAPLMPVLRGADGAVVGGTLHLAFGPPSSRLSPVGLLSWCCCCSGAPVALVLCSADGLVVGVDSTLCPRAPFPGSLRCVLFRCPDGASLALC